MAEIAGVGRRVLLNVKAECWLVRIFGPLCPGLLSGRNGWVTRLLESEKHVQGRRPSTMKESRQPRRERLVLTLIRSQGCRGPGIDFLSSVDVTCAGSTLRLLATRRPGGTLSAVHLKLATAAAMPVVSGVSGRSGMA